MRDLTNLDHFRIRSAFVKEQFSSYGDGGNGAFIIPVPGQMTELKVVASDGEGWDHISVSLNGAQRAPTWAEMEVAKKAFLGDVVAWQYHMNAADHVNIHPYVLHIWRKQDFVMPVPPKWFV